MTPEAARDAADLLINARVERNVLLGFPEACRPISVDDGYAVQSAFIERWREPVAGWKVACTSEDQKRMVKVAEPFSGPLFGKVIFDSPAELRLYDFHKLGVECEFAFRIGADLPPRDAPYSRDEAAGACAALVPAIEIVSPRYADWLALGAAAIIADCAANGGLVIGADVAGWQGLDLAAQGIALSLDGETVADGTGSLVLGNPLESLLWLVNDRAARGAGLRAGDIVTTGTCTGLHFVDPGVEAVADFGALGRVSVRFIR